MNPADPKARLKELYLPPANKPVLVDVPDLRYVCIDGYGAGDRSSLDRAVKWLFTVIHPIKRIARERMGRDFADPPLEGLWWADDVEDFMSGNRNKLYWRMMIVFEDLVSSGSPTSDLFTREMLEDGVAAARSLLGEPPPGLRLETHREGLSAQIMHVGSPCAQVDTLARLHRDFLPANDLIPAGRHHEIYLTDPNRVAPEKMRTVLRQPVRHADTEPSGRSQA